MICNPKTPPVGGSRTGIQGESTICHSKWEISDNIVRGIFSSPSIEKELDYAIDEYIIAAAEKRPGDDILMIDFGTGEELKIKDYIRKSYCLAAELQDLGCAKNTIVGIICENRVEIHIVVLATLLTGATFTAYNPNFSQDELKLLYSIAKPSIIFCSAEYCNKFQEIASAGSKLIVFESVTSLPNVAKFSDLIDSGSAKVLRKVENKPDDIACISYSSGTTGLPKGVTSTHKNVMYAIIFLREYIANNGRMTLILTPINIYVTGIILCLAGVVRNETIVSIPKPDMISFLSAIQKYQVRRLLVYTGILTFLLKDPIVSNYDLSSVEIVYSGGAPIAADVEKAFVEKFKLQRFQQVYGLTEAVWTTTKHPESSKIGTCGAPVGGMEVKIIDQGTRKILGKNEIGELCIRGPNVTKGYYENEEATAASIDKEGWFYSGDIAYYDNEGEFYIVGRSKELIKVKGSPVAPAELEALLLEHPSITDAAVIGIPNEYFGEVPRAYVVKREGKTITEDEVIQYVAEKVVSYKRLEGGVEFITKIPKNTASKILRKELKELWNNGNKQKGGR